MNFCINYSVAGNFLLSKSAKRIVPEVIKYRFEASLYLLIYLSIQPQRNYTGDEINYSLTAY